jgi:hypothetical protein
MLTDPDVLVKAASLSGSKPAQVATKRTACCITLYAGQDGQAASAAQTHNKYHRSCLSEERAHANRTQPEALLKVAASPSGAGALLQIAHNQHHTSSSKRHQVSLPCCVANLQLHTTVAFIIP